MKARLIGFFDVDDREAVGAVCDVSVRAGKVEFLGVVERNCGVGQRNGN
jgi:hypothetical protein